MDKAQLEHYAAYAPDELLLYSLGAHGDIVARRLPGHDLQHSEQMLTIINEEITRRRAGWMPWVVFV